MSQRRIFISYSSKDREFIIRLANELKLLGYEVWFDQELKRRGGHQWWAEIMEALRQSDIFLYAGSDNLVASEPCKREYKYALDLGKPVLPVQIGSLNYRNVPITIQSSQILDIRDLIHDQRNDLKISIDNLPAAPELRPNALELEPPPPLDPIGVLIERINTLTPDGLLQDSLLSDISKLLADPRTYDDGIDLLNRLKRRSNVLIVENLTRTNQMLRQPRPDKLIQSDKPARNPSLLLIGAAASVVILLAVIVLVLRQPAFGTGTPTAEPTATELAAFVPSITSQPSAVRPTALIVPTFPPQTITAITSSIPPTTTPIPLNATLISLAVGSQRTDSFGVPQVYVPAGCFMMGSDPTKDPYAQDNEKPQHNVCISQAFWLDKSDVTNAEFDVFVKAGGYSKQTYWSTEGWQWLQTNTVTGPKADCTQYSSAPDQPRICVNYYEAEAYAKWRNGRIPTEAEWEYAARGQGKSPPIYPWGDAFSPTKANVSTSTTSEVCAYSTGNSWVGACDMAGNVFQWVADWYDSAYYQHSLPNDPGGPTTGQYRVLRGGSWDNDSGYARATYRGYRDPGYRLGGGGFRLICVVTPPSN